MELEAGKRGGNDPTLPSQTPRAAPEPPSFLVKILRGVDQQRIVLAIAVVLFILFSIFLNGFIDPGNILTLLQGVAVIGVLGLGMAIVIIGRGIDLSMIAVLVMPTVWMFVEIGNGVAIWAAATSALAMAIAAGILNGLLIAYLEVPAIFATLASGTIVYGTMQYLAVSNDIVPIPAQLAWLAPLLQSSVLGVPTVVIFFGVVALLTWLFLRYTVYGRYIYAIGDNPIAARTTGVPVRPILVLQYVLSAIIAVGREAARPAGRQGRLHRRLRRGNGAIPPNEGAGDPAAVGSDQPQLLHHRRLPRSLCGRYGHRPGPENLLLRSHQTLRGQRMADRRA